uniref:Uncharacterized protein n=1 Tax=Chromera velia CCMP2878 TaxID=1169474 RepID=A0A0G4H3Y3_9ALVE|eukprot:Cvel_5651.t1-p1 / transcript=Cvel_5651.t1 / gene=Cvel_5651 / organism=Chromera_velia_CCMP2878 / gene_product=hypothetical protein / transcript_product=hypothetical protein / location=Cvel_scaffold267:371-10030(+) / protein_length=1160 / sequence_SO=supercontig / SO=protein_coding / is_pseudo=false
MGNQATCNIQSTDPADFDFSFGFEGTPIHYFLSETLRVDYLKEFAGCPLNRVSTWYAKVRDFNLGSDLTAYRLSVLLDLPASVAEHLFDLLRFPRYYVPPRLLEGPEGEQLLTGTEGQMGQRLFVPPPAVPSLDVLSALGIMANADMEHKILYLFALHDIKARHLLDFADFVRLVECTLRGTARFVEGIVEFDDVYLMRTAQHIWFDLLELREESQLNFNTLAKWAFDSPPTVYLLWMRPVPPSLGGGGLSMSAGPPAAPAPQGGAGPSGSDADQRSTQTKALTDADGVAGGGSASLSGGVVGDSVVVEGQELSVGKDGEGGEGGGETQRSGKLTTSRSLGRGVPATKLPEPLRDRTLLTRALEETSRLIFSRKKTDWEARLDTPLDQTGKSQLMRRSESTLAARGPDPLVACIALQASMKKLSRHPSEPFVPPPTCSTFISSGKPPLTGAFSFLPDRLPKAKDYDQDGPDAPPPAKATLKRLQICVKPNSNEATTSSSKAAQHFLTSPDAPILLPRRAAGVPKSADIFDINDALIKEEVRHQGKKSGKIFTRDFNPLMGDPSLLKSRQKFPLWMDPFILVADPNDAGKGIRQVVAKSLSSFKRDRVRDQEYQGQSLAQSFHIWKSSMGKILQQVAVHASNRIWTAQDVFEFAKGPEGIFDPPVQKFAEEAVCCPVPSIQMLGHFLRKIRARGLKPFNQILRMVYHPTKAHLADEACDRAEKALVRRAQATLRWDAAAKFAGLVGRATLAARRGVFGSNAVDRMVRQIVGGKPVEKSEDPHAKAFGQMAKKLQEKEKKNDAAARAKKKTIWFEASADAEDLSSTKFRDLLKTFELVDRGSKGYLTFEDIYASLCDPKYSLDRYQDLFDNYAWFPPQDLRSLSTEAIPSRQTRVFGRMYLPNFLRMVLPPDVRAPPDLMERTPAHYWPAGQHPTHQHFGSLPASRAGSRAASFVSRPTLSRQNSAKSGAGDFDVSTNTAMSATGIALKREASQPKTVTSSALTMSHTIAGDSAQPAQGPPGSGPEDVRSSAGKQSIAKGSNGKSSSDRGGKGKGGRSPAPSETGRQSTQNGGQPQALGSQAHPAPPQSAAKKEKKDTKKARSTSNLDEWATFPGMKDQKAPDPNNLAELQGEKPMKFFDSRPYYKPVERQFPASHDANEKR